MLLLLLLLRIPIYYRNHPCRQTWDSRNLSSPSPSPSLPIFPPHSPASASSPAPIVTSLLWSEAAGGLVAGGSDGSVWVGGGGGVEGRRLEGRAVGSAVTAIARLVLRGGRTAAATHSHHAACDVLRCSDTSGGAGGGSRRVLSGGADGHVIMHTLP